MDCTSSACLCVLALVPRSHPGENNLRRTSSRSHASVSLHNNRSAEQQFISDPHRDDLLPRRLPTTCHFKQLTPAWPMCKDTDGCFAAEHTPRRAPFASQNGSWSRGGSSARCDSGGVRGGGGSCDQRWGRHVGSSGAAN